MSGIPATEQFWCEGLLGCPLHCKSHLAAFYNGSPDVTFGRELQMATMWEGYCAFDAICTVINSVKKKKKKSYYQCYIVLWCLIHEVWFWGLADYLHVRLPSWRPRFGLISGEKSKPEVGALLRDEKWKINNESSLTSPDCLCAGPGLDVHVPGCGLRPRGEELPMGTQRQGWVFLDCIPQSVQPLSMKRPGRAISWYCLFSKKNFCFLSG